MENAQQLGLYNSQTWLTSVSGVDGGDTGGNYPTEIPKEWQKANEALQEVQQSKSDSSTSSPKAGNQFTVTAQQQSNTMGYSYQQYWPSMYAYTGYQNYMSNYNYYQMPYRNGYASYPFYMSPVATPPSAPDNSIVPHQMQSPGEMPLCTTESAHLPQDSQVITSTDEEAAVKLLASQPPPPPPASPPAPPPGEDEEMEETKSGFLHRNKQAPGAGGIRFSMPKRKPQKGNSLLALKNKKEKNNKNRNSLGNNCSNFFSIIDPMSDDDEDSSKVDGQNSLDIFRPYVSNSFNRCKSEEEKNKMAEKLKELFGREEKRGTLWKKDWSTEPPLSVHDDQIQKDEICTEERGFRLSPNQSRCMSKQKSSFHKSSRQRHQVHSRSRSRSRSRSPQSRRVVRRRRYSSGSDSSCSSGGGGYVSRKPGISSSIVGPSEARGGSTKGWNNTHSGKKKKNKKKNKMQFAADPDFNNSDRLQRRAARFETAGGKKGGCSLLLTINNPSANFEDASDIDWSSYAIVGTCEDIEKPFLRITSAVDPSTIRPEEVLVKSLQMVKDHWVEHQDYHFACEQLKSIRQDLVVQCIRNSFTIQAYETHARIALEKGDHTEFNQCQSQLKVLYEELNEGNRMEFLGYRILYNIYTKDTRELKNIISTLSQEDKEDEVVSHALNLNSAWILNNYHVFFKLYITAPKMSGFVIDWFIQDVRKAALKAFIKAFRPSIPVAFIEKKLAFSSLEETQTFLEEVQCVLSNDKLNVLTKESSQAVL